MNSESDNASHLRIAPVEEVVESTNPVGPRTILLVDDDVDCRMMLSDAIWSVCPTAAVIELSDGAAAIQYLEQADASARPDLVFLDIEMPRLDGLEALRRIKGDSRFKDIPVVMLTGLQDDLSLRRAATYGANSYTVKPADAERFLKTVLNSATYWLHIHRHRGPSAEAV